MSNQRRTQKSSLAVDRRHLLKAFGSAALALPFLRGLAGQIAHAQVGVGDLRFFFLFTGNGMTPQHWLPTGGATNFTLAPALAPLAPYRDKLLLVHGLEGGSGHHIGMSETTTARPSIGEITDGRANGGPSIDQFLADHWRGTTPLSSLETGVAPSNGSNDQTCYSASGLPIPAIGSALGAFERVFAVTNESPVVAEARRRRRRSVLDSVARDITAIQGRIGASSRALLDEHLTLVRAQEAELMRPYVPLNCALPGSPNIDADSMLQTWQAHNQTIAAAFRCGTTRVASLRVGGWGGAGGYAEFGFENGHHNVHHGGTSDFMGHELEIDNWHAQRFADLLGVLDGVPDGDGTLLDSTVVVWFNELGLGGANNHGRDDVPVVIAGGSRAGFKNNQYLNLGGVQYQHFLYTLARVVSGADISRFGDAGTTLLTSLLT